MGLGLSEHRNCVPIPSKCLGALTEVVLCSIVLMLFPCLPLLLLFPGIGSALFPVLHWT